MDSGLFYDAAATEILCVARMKTRNQHVYYSLDVNFYYFVILSLSKVEFCGYGVWTSGLYEAGNFWL